MPRPSRTPNQIAIDCTRNQNLIDCFLSGQISSQQWEHHLADEPGLQTAWERRPYKLSDGTDISRKTVDQIKAAQQRADLAFLDKARTRSPKYPTLDEALRRRQMRREALAARVLLGLVPLGIIGSIWNSIGWIIAGFAFLGFVLTCFIAGDRVPHNGSRHGSIHGQPTRDCFRYCPFAYFFRSLRNGALHPCQSTTAGAAQEAGALLVVLPDRFDLAEQLRRAAHDRRIARKYETKRDRYDRRLPLWFPAFGIAILTLGIFLASWATPRWLM
jgi:hypothetical protein